MWLVILFIAITGLAQSGKIDSVDYLSPLENEIVREINLARKNPKAYAFFLEQLKSYYDGNLFKRPGEIIIKTEEGISAVDEGIRFLQTANPAPPLSPSKGMSLGARDHVKDQGVRGTRGHQGSDRSQPWDRVDRYGKWKKMVGENIFYGDNRAREIVMGLIIDDGVPDRGHRKNLFNPDFRIVGVACGYHATYGTMCVITFAGEFKDKKR
jgi:uncharacterized protein YkwD